MEDGMETPVKKTETVEVEAADGRRKRRRVVLGDITQEANSGVLDGGGKKKGGLKSVSELVIIDINKKVIEPHDDCNNVGVDPVTLVCPKDASEIDTYLRSMEVCHCDFVRVFSFHCFLLPQINHLPIICADASGESTEC